MTDPSFDPIFAYLREHSARCGLEALGQELVQSGYHPADVERAIAIYQHEQHENPPALPVRFWRKLLLVVVVNALLVVAGIGALAFGGSGDVMSLVGFVLSLIGFGELLGGIVLALMGESRTWGLALVFGFLLSTAFAILILGGLCARYMAH